MTISPNVPMKNAAADVYVSIESRPELLRSVPAGFDRAELYSRSDSFSNTSINQIAYLITGVSSDSPMDLRGEFLSRYADISDGLSPKQSAELAQEYLVYLVENYIVWANARLSWFRVQCSREGNGKSASTKEQLAHKISEVERKVWFFSRQLLLAAQQKMFVPETVAPKSLALRVLAAVKSRFEFAWQKRNAFSRLER